MKAAAVEAEVEVDDISRSVEEVENVPVVDQQVMPSAVAGLSYNQMDQAKAKFYRRGATYSVGHAYKKAKINKAKAKGCMKLDGFFGIVAPEAEPVEEEPSQLEKIREVMGKLEEITNPAINVNSPQQKMGVYELVRYQAVQQYFELRLLKKKKMEASMQSATLFWKTKTTTYRSRMVRRDAEEFLLSGSIIKNRQGKHAKRSSVLDDNDIKEKAIEWFRSVPHFQRNLQSLRNQLKNVILPECVGSSTLSDEVDESGVSTQPLSIT